MASAKPSKQRKRLFQAPKHRQRRMLSARLSDDLTARHKVRRIPLRTGDTVRIMRGEFADLVGKVEKVEYSTGRIFVEGMTRRRRPASHQNFPFTLVRYS